MTETANAPKANIPHLARTLTAVIIGTLVLRTAAGAMGENIQFYFNAIHEASLNPNHPLNRIVGAAHVYPISYTLGSIIIGTFFAAELIGAVLLGAWSDRYGRKVFIIFGPIFGAIAVQITALTTLVWMLIFTRLLEGLSTASNAPATLGYVAETTAHSPKLRTRIAGFFEIATIGGFALGFILGGLLWKYYGTAAVIAGIPLTSPAFALNAVIYLVSLVILWIGVREVGGKRTSTGPVASPKETLKRYWQIVRSPRVLGFAPAWIAINAVLGIWINLTPRILTDKNAPGKQLLAGHFDTFAAGNIVAGYALVFVIGILIWSIFFAGVKKVNAMLIGTGGLFAACLLLYVLNHQPALDAPLVLPVALLLMASIMVQSGFTPAALAHLADVTEIHANDRGAIMGLYSVFLGLGQFLGTALGGPFVDWLGADGMVLAITLLGIFSAFLLVRLQRSESRANLPERVKPEIENLRPDQ